MGKDILLSQDIGVLSEWIGRTEAISDRLDAGPARRMQATLDQTPDFTEGRALPPFWHYLYFNPETTASDLKADGHEKLGRFLPPVSLPRRMWASGSVVYDKPIYCGEVCTKTSTIRDIVMKDGRSGPLCFVTVDHDFSVDGEHRFKESQNIVYREMPAPDTVSPPGRPAPSEPGASQKITPDEVMLFRYSALIFYSHRIHYDADYTRDVEGYPGLVVHGPLIASLLSGFGCAQHPDATLKSLDIRAMSPLFSPDPFYVEATRNADGVHTWARGHDGSLAMTVDLKFAPDTEDT